MKDTKRFYPHEIHIIYIKKISVSSRIDNKTVNNIISLVLFFKEEKPHMSKPDFSPLWIPFPSRWTASPVTAEAVAEWHRPDGGAVVGVRPAGGVRGAAVEARHALQEALAPEEEAETVRIVEVILTSLYQPSVETEEVLAHRR